jgi:hypothetical protein
MARRTAYLLLLGVAIWTQTSAQAPTPRPVSPWKVLEHGLELGTFQAEPDSTYGDSIIRILRIDPDRFELRLLNASGTTDGQLRTAREWCRANGAIAAINASMYRSDKPLMSVSLMRTRTHTNNSHLTKDNTILAFDALSSDVPPVKLIDRQCDGFDTWSPKYGTLVQSIRMVSCKGKNVWTQQPKKWSIAAIGMDHDGRVLFIHVRSPYTVHDFINILLGLPLGLSRAMYVEGGPEAQLYVRNAEKEHEFVGSYETDFNENDHNPRAWAVPNVVAVVRKGDDKHKPGP